MPDSKSARSGFLGSFAQGVHDGGQRWLYIFALSACLKTTYTIPSRRLFLFLRGAFNIVKPRCFQNVSLPSHVVVLLLQDISRIPACLGLGTAFHVIPRPDSRNLDGVTRHAAASHLMRAQFHASRLLQGQSYDVNPIAPQTITVI